MVTSESARWRSAQRQADAAVRSADLGHLGCAQLGDRFDEERLRNSSQVVEADRAVAGHSIACIELNLGVNAADRAGYKRDHDVSELRNGLIAG